MLLQWTDNNVATFLVVVPIFNANIIGITEIELFDSADDKFLEHRRFGRVLRIKMKILKMEERKEVFLLIVFCFNI